MAKLLEIILAVTIPSLFITAVGTPLVLLIVREAERDG